MFEGDGFAGLGATLNRTWIIFFERLFRRQGEQAPGPFQRTILLKDTTVGNDVADHVTVYGPEPARASYSIVRITGVLRKTISSALTLRVNVVSANLTSAVVGTFTIPSTAAVNQVISFNLKTLTTKELPDKGVLTWDVTASDGSQDNAGVASFTVEWQ